MSEGFTENPLLLSGSGVTRQLWTPVATSDIVEQYSAAPG